MVQMKKHSALLWLMAGSACLLAAVVSICVGSVWYSPAAAVSGLLGMGDPTSATILLYSRLPRTLAALFAGAALAVSGAVLQNVLGNRLASPGVIGVNAGAGLGVTVCSALGILAGFPVSCAAFLGSLVTVFFIFLLWRRSGAGRTTVILCGVALNSILNAAAESVTVLVPDAAALTVDYRIGGFSAISYPRLLPAMALIALGLLVLLTLGNELDIVSLGDSTAQSVGLNAKKYRLVFLALAALLAGSAVSFAGLLGFVGLIVPHFVRRLAGSESRRLLPLCALVGGAFVTACDTAARVIFLPYELPVGILMAIIGGPVFVLMLLGRKGDSGHD